jgi:hypothetical protein
MILIIFNLIFGGIQIYITKENYYKVINQIIKLTKDKMSLNTLSNVVNYFYFKGKIDAILN